MTEPIIFNVTSNFGHRTNKPFVMVAVGAPHEFMTQMSPDEARDLAHNLSVILPGRFTHP